jgi:hypothetical protein
MGHDLEMSHQEKIGEIEERERMILANLNRCAKRARWQEMSSRIDPLKRDEVKIVLFVK